MALLATEPVLPRCPRHLGNLRHYEVRVEIAELSLAGSDVREAGKEIYCDPR